MPKWERTKYSSSYWKGDKELGRVVLLPSGKWVATEGAQDYIAEYARRRSAERAVESKVAHAE